MMTLNEILRIIVTATVSAFFAGLVQVVVLKQVLRPFATKKKPGKEQH